jgi:hypothetical protein
VNSLSFPSGHLLSTPWHGRHRPNFATSRARVAGAEELPRSYNLPGWVTTIRLVGAREQSLLVKVTSGLKMRLLAISEVSGAKALVWARNHGRDVPCFDNQVISPSFGPVMYRPARL